MENKLLFLGNIKKKEKKNIQYNRVEMLGIKILYFFLRYDVKKRN